MAGLNFTTTSRRTAANILATTLNVAAKSYLVTDELLQPFLTLCQDTDLEIRKRMISNCNNMLPILKSRDIISQITAEVLHKILTIAFVNSKRGQHNIEMANY